MKSKRGIQTRKRWRNWRGLPEEVTSRILLKLGAIDILTNAQFVCSSWYKICKNPLMWRVIDMHNSGDLGSMKHDLEIMCKHAVDRSCGQLLDINIEYFLTEDLLQYVIRSSNRLKNLRIGVCFDIENELSEAASKLPSLELLEISLCEFSEEILKTIGRCCPLLKSLKLNKKFWKGRDFASDDEALAIAETMPQLHHLQLFGNRLTDKGLQAILDGCPDLQSLDLRQCFNLNLAEQLEKRVAERIKILHLPHDPTDGYKYCTRIVNFDDNLCGAEEISAEDREFSL